MASKKVTQKKDASDIDAILDAVPTESQLRKKCKICDNERWADIVLRWLDRKEAGEDMPSLYALTRIVLEGQTGHSTVDRHVRVCLGRSHRTGKKL